MKTPDEIKSGLKKCYGTQSCAGCPYYDLIDCNNALTIDALSYIEQLEERIRLMLIQMQGDCGCCKHVTVGIGTEPCASCLHKRDHDAWDYRGLPGDE